MIIVSDLLALNFSKNECLNMVSFIFNEKLKR